MVVDLRVDGTVLCFGLANTTNGTLVFGQLDVPQQPDDVYEVIEATRDGVCGKRVDGRFECWGRYTDNDPQGSDRSLEPPVVDDQGAALCGNGEIDLSEVCDDGNTLSGDGCSADCESDETCGNGQVDLGELCDDGGDVGEVLGDFCSDVGDPGDLPGCHLSTQCDAPCDECTESVCDPQLGCSGTPVPDGTTCNAGSGLCLAGECGSSLIAPRLAMSGTTACHIGSDAELRCWGAALDIVAGIPPGFLWKDVDLSGSNACGITFSGDTKCWGDGVLVPTASSNPPHLSIAVTDTAACGSDVVSVNCWGAGSVVTVGDIIGSFLSDVVQISSASQSVCIVLIDGFRICWGDVGQVGAGSLGGLFSESGPFTETRSGENFHCALTNAGTWSCLDIAPAEPGAAIPTLPLSVDVALSSATGCGVDVLGVVSCWGTPGLVIDFIPNDPVRDVFTRLAMGTGSACGIRQDESVECWGAFTDDDAEAPLLEPPGVCGNGINEPAEACDDGNTAAGDSCSADCESVTL